MELKNNLRNAGSPYLEEAADQPVRWQSFSEEVFKMAAQMDRPILLDIGAVWCHWCHVMDEESYSDQEVAGIINRLFVPVKVDRDQMPDVDSRYQASIGSLTGAGGWPLTGFLTSEGKVFYGGTYFPKHDVSGRHGMLSLLPRIAEVYSKDRAEVYRSADELFERVSEYESAIIRAGRIEEEIVENVIEDARRRFDDKFGGFGSGPKFFNPCLLQLLIEENKHRVDPTIKGMVDVTLRSISMGGVFDQLGGGLHRYSVDRYWHVPHFEKMLYDNAMMLKVYADFYDETLDVTFRKTASGIADWMTSEMQSEAGGFFAHQDADVGPKDDGSYWTWTKSEVVSLLTPEEFAVAENVFDLREVPGDTPELADRNVLRVAMDDLKSGKVAGISREHCRDLIDSAKIKLLQAQKNRKMPFVDKTYFADRNALAISGLVAASLSLKSPQYLESAKRSARFVLDEMVGKKGRVAHSFNSGSDFHIGLLDDHSYLGLALIDLFELTRNDRYIDTCERIASTLIQKFEDKETGGFLDRPFGESGAGLLTSKRKPIEDSPTPSGNSAAALLFDRLYLLTDNKEYFKSATRTLNAFAGSTAKLGIFVANYARAVRLHLSMERGLNG